MRAGLGLLALLITIGLMIWLFAMIEIPKAKVYKQIQPQVQQMSGHGLDGETATSSFQTEGKFKGSTLEGIRVTSVSPGGAMDTHFGLRPKDLIVAVGGIQLNVTANGDDEMAKAQVAEAFQRSQTITVRRGGKTLELPLPPGSAIPPLPTTPAPAPPVPAPNSPTDAAAGNPVPAQQDGLHRQLDSIQDAAGKQ